jgi:polysaccharide export outer membrane protein
MKIRFLLFALSAILLVSCQSVPKNIVYFEDFNDLTQKEVDFHKYEPTIKSNDQLMISVSSPVLDQTQVAQFNLPMNSSLAPGGTVVQSVALQTYTVDKDGYINFPVIGKIQLEGLTRSEAIGLMTGEISKYLETPIVNLQIISFGVTVLGEVARPGRVSVSNERISILDALGSVGDLTIFANRTNIKLVRDNSGVKEFAIIDLTRSDLFSSPYYYLQQNDVLIVEPNDTRKKASKFGAAESYQISMMSLGFTAVSVIVSFLGLLLK